MKIENIEELVWYKTFMKESINSFGFISQKILMIKIHHYYKIF